MPPALLRVLSLGVVLGLLSVACADPSPTTTSPTSTPSVATTVAATVTTVTAAGTPDRFDVQGHRGARGLRPENTLPAFEIALDLMVTTLELDLHFSADGRVIVWHDPEISPEKCGRSPEAPADVPDPDTARSSDLRVSRLTAEQLAGLSCDRNPDPTAFPDQIAEPTVVAGTDSSIVTLDRLFAFVAAYAESPEKTAEQRANAAGVWFNIETKRRVDQPSAIDDGFDGIHAGPFELAVLAAIEKADLRDRVVVQSFDHRSLVAIHAVDAEIRLAALTSRVEPDLATYAGFGASIWSPNRRDVTGARVEAAHELGLLVVPWTVNEPTEIRKLVQLGVDGIISDRPDLVIEELAEA